MKDKVSQSEVKRHFLLADAGKELFRKDMKLKKLELRYKYEEMQERFENMGEEQLNELIRNKIRLKRYDSMDWYKGEALLDKMAPWPKMFELDIGLTTGNVIDTTAGISLVWERKSNLHFPEKFFTKIYSLEEHIDFVRDRFPLILFPGGEVREKEYNKWARKNKKPLCKVFDYDIDDGNCRAVSYALSGLRKAPSYIGVYPTR